MGGGPSGDSSGMGIEADVRGIAKQRADRQRQAMAKTGVQDPYEFTRLAENLQAQKLEKEAKAASLTGSKLADLAIPGAGALSLVEQFSKEQQARELRRGGEMILGPSGEYKGVVREGVYSGDPDFDPISGGPQEGDDSTPVQRADITPERTPEITPEVIPNDEPITTRYARRRTKRAGQAGTIMEGYGVLTRAPSKRAVT